jgi:hypothetical protein
MCEGNNRTDHIPECVGCLVGLTLNDWTKTQPKDVGCASMWTLCDRELCVRGTIVQTLPECVGYLVGLSSGTTFEGNNRTNST